MPATWLALEDALSPFALTVRAQTISPNDTGELLWDGFLPREDVDSVDLLDIYTLDYRPAADRREWDGRGRRIPPQAPSRRQVSIVPIEANDKIDEKELQRLGGGSPDSVNAERLREILGVTVPTRIDRLADACYRRLEVDAFAAWALGVITQRSPEDSSKTYAASFGFSAARYLTAGTAWNAVANAYTTFTAWLLAAEDLIGPVEGAMMRLATFNEILADAPQLPNQVTMTRSQLAERVTQDIGREFQFFINEKSVDVFDDGGTAVTRTKVWPAQRVAAIPEGMKVGRTAFAPVLRAMEIRSQVGVEAGVDVRGCTAYSESLNGGRQLDLEVQLNAMPIPDEQKMYVINAGV